MEISYYNYRIPKGKSGKFRWICEPNKQLKEFQTKKLNEVFYKVLPHEANHGFIQNKSIATNASMHVGRQYVLSMDVKSFFPNCTRQKVKKVLQEFFLSECKNIEYFLYKDALPQGAPTSPYLANFTLYEFDKTLHEYCILNNATYTRYADDITVSYDKKELTKELFLLINKEIKKYDFRISRKKTKVMPKHKRQIVTGFIVNEKLNIPYEKRNLLRAWNHLNENQKWSADDTHLLAGWNGYKKMTRIKK